MDPVSLATAAISAQQSSLQQNLGITVVKQSQDAEQAVVNMISNALSSSGRGQHVNVLA